MTYALIYELYINCKEKCMLLETFKIRIINNWLTTFAKCQYSFNDQYPSMAVPRTAPEYYVAFTDMTCRFH